MANTYQETLRGYKWMILDNKEVKDNMDKENNPRLDKSEKRNWTDIIYQNLKNSTVFKIDEDLTQIFLNTDSNMEYLHTPFDLIFIDTKIKITENLEVCGLFVEDSKEDKTLGIVCLVKGKEGKKTITHLIHFGIKYWKKINELNNALTENLECDLDKPLVRRKLGLFVISFLKFLSNPEVEILKKEYTPIRIRRRAEQGRPVNNHHYLKITGKTRKYINDFSSGLSKTYDRKTSCWIVRGYYMKLKHKRYKENIGKEVWVAPYVKGLGEAKKKEYLVTEKKKVYMGQLRMENLIEGMFPNHLVLSNTRGFLDGLEIDCYIPDLKLGFEYNGEQHYNHVEIFHKTIEDFEAQKQRDVEKNKLAKEKGIDLITIRYNEKLTKDLIKSKIKSVGVLFV